MPDPLTMAPYLVRSASGTPDASTVQAAFLIWDRDTASNLLSREEERTTRTALRTGKTRHNRGEETGCKRLLPPLLVEDLRFRK